MVEIIKYALCIIVGCLVGDAIADWLTDITTNRKWKDKK